MSLLPSIKIPVRSHDIGRTIGVQIPKKLVESARTDISKVLGELNSGPTGLSTIEVDKRLEKFGANEVAREKRRNWFIRLWDNIKNPLVILLILLGVISFITGDLRATIVILTMVILGIVLRYVQESRADNAAEQLKAMVRTTTTVIRDGQRREIPLKDLVPGDIVTLSAGDMISR